MALCSLEHISNELHAKRRARLCLPVRTPGVGAETEEEGGSLSGTMDIPSVDLGISALFIHLTVVGESVLKSHRIAPKNVKQTHRLMWTPSTTIKVTWKGESLEKS